MKVYGSILIDSGGINTLISDNECVERVIMDYIEMRDEADRSYDKLYYENDENWQNFFLHLYSEESNLRSHISQVCYQDLISDSNLGLNCLKNQNEFSQKVEPKTKGGFSHQYVQGTFYVCDKKTIDAWHYRWFLNNPEMIDWEESPNNIFPCYEATLHILQKELRNHGRNINVNSRDVINSFHDTMKHLNNHDRIDSAKRIGVNICQTNYYKREKELERLEQSKGNKKAKIIFSLLKEGKYQFLSIDTQHCMFELCDDKGDHIGELRFDGSPNGNETREVHHGLKCVREWIVHHNR